MLTYLPDFLGAKRAGVVAPLPDFIAVDPAFAGEDVLVFAATVAVRAPFDPPAGFPPAAFAGLNPPDLPAMMNPP
jgi:hypothetical protein